MNTVYEAFTAALFHFLWQGAAIAALLSVVLVALRRSSPNSRYLAACVALGLMVVLPAVTTIALYEPQGVTATPAAPALPGEPVLEVVGTAGPPGGETAAGALQVGAFDVLPLSLPLPKTVLREWAIPVWLLGMMLFSLRLLWAYGYVVGMRQSATASDAETFALAQRLAERMGIARPFRVMLSSLADGPSVVGWWRPVILLPSAALLGLTAWQLEAVLAHEFAHIRRRDYLVNLLQSVVEILLFYHPAVWWVSNCVRRERELCCDDLAVAVSGDAVGYARALTILERQRLTVPEARAAMAIARPAMAAAGGWLGLRVRRLVGLVHDPNRPTFVSGLLALGLAIGILAVGVSSTDSVAQEGVPEPVGADAGIEPVEAGAGIEPVEVTLEIVEPVELPPLELRIAQAEGDTQDLTVRRYAEAVAEGAAASSEGRYFNVDGRRLRWTDSVTWGGQLADVDRVTRAARASELSAAQLAAVESIVESYRARITAAAARVRSDESSLETLLAAETVERAAVTSTIESLISARGELDRTTTEMALTIRLRLNRDEWIRLQGQLGSALGLYMGRVTVVTSEDEAGAEVVRFRVGGAGAGAQGAGGRRGWPPPAEPAAGADAPIATQPTPQ